ncbi:glycoside hydrolase [Myxococcota bacterium]|nr:glycoside hydrolase [Myxococcota bacterium]
MFKSFFLAGFECATGYNVHGAWIDQIAATKHDVYVDDDYRALAEIGIFGVREAVRWPLVDRRWRYDFASVEPFVRAAEAEGMEVIWDLFHYGYPDGLDPFSRNFVDHFANYCHAVVHWLRPRVDGTLYFTPVNEPSFFAWAAAEVGRFAPHARGRSDELKIRLAEAGIRGIDAIRAVDAAARIVNVDPICHVVAPEGRGDLIEAAERFNTNDVFESWDMLAGTRYPELGGSRAHLDLVGVNYYWTNQWQLGGDTTPLADADPRRVPLSTLLSSVWARYGGELLVTETSHVGDMRPVWLAEAAREAELLLEAGVPLRGMCLYPILGMPEWHDPDTYTRMGLWDPVADAPSGATAARIHAGGRARPSARSERCAARHGVAREVCTPMLDALREAQRLDALHLRALRSLSEGS